jgi:hypothetical protein
MTYTTQHIPLTPKKWENNSRAKACEYEAYLRLHEWHYKKRWNNRIGAALLQKSYYTDTKHREFSSKWLENVIKAFLRWHGWSVAKPDDKGRQIIGKNGKPIRINHRTVTKGTADIISKHVLPSGLGSLIVNWEVKIGKDTQSDAQRLEQQRAQANGELYFVIKTLGGFFKVWDEVVVGLVRNKHN